MNADSSIKKEKPLSTKEHLAFHRDEYHKAQKKNPRNKDGKQGFHPCRICTHPDRPRLEKKLKKYGIKQPRKDLNFTKIAKYLWKYGNGWPQTYSSTDSLLVAIRNHYNHLEKAPQYLLVEVEKDVNGGMERATVEKFAQNLLDIAQAGLEVYKDHPERLDPKIALDAQKLLVSRKNSQTKEKALLAGMARLFGGFMPELVEGEIDESDLDGE